MLEWLASLKENDGVVVVATLALREAFAFATKRTESLWKGKRDKAEIEKTISEVTRDEFDSLLRASKDMREEMQGNARALKFEYETLRREHAELKKAHEEQSRRLQRVESENTQLRSEVELLRSEREAMTAKIETLTHEAEDYRREAGALVLVLKEANLTVPSFIRRYGDHLTVRDRSE